MAKRTNKTSHVLNLLSGGAEADVTKPKSNNVTVDDLAKVDPLAQNIKDSLLLDLDDSGGVGEVVSATKEVAVSSTEEVATDTLADNKAEEVLEVELEAAIEADLAKMADDAPAVLEKEVREADLVQFAPIASTEDDVPTTSIEEAFESAAESLDEKPKEVPQKNGENEVKRLSDSLGKDDFEFLSVMEYIIEQEIHEYKKNFNVCECSRCTADVMALALTNLPAKFVVAAKDSVSPILNFYSKKYATEVTVALTNACVQVGERPHHVRPR